MAFCNLSVVGALVLEPTFTWGQGPFQLLCHTTLQIDLRDTMDLCINHLQILAGHDVYQDMVENTRIGPWLEKMDAAVAKE